MKHPRICFNLVLTLSISWINADAQFKDEYGVEYDKNYIAKTDSGKQDQLFRAINTIRNRNGLTTLSYKRDDQKMADLRAKRISKEFRADTVDCRGEVIFRGSFEEISVRALDFANKNNFHYMDDMTYISVGVTKRWRTFYTVIRVF